MKDEHNNTQKDTSKTTLSIKKPTRLKSLKKVLKCFMRL